MPLCRRFPPRQGGRDLSAGKRQTATTFTRPNPLQDMTRRPCTSRWILRNRPTLSFALTDQKTDLEIASLLRRKRPRAGSGCHHPADQGLDPDPVVLVVTRDGGGRFAVHADGGFRAGGTYEMTLGEGLASTRIGTERYRTVALTFAKRRGRTTSAFDPDVVFIQDTDEYSYYLDVPGSVDEFVPVLTFRSMPTAPQRSRPKYATTTAIRN